MKPQLLLSLLALALIASCKKEDDNAPSGNGGGGGTDTTGNGGNGLVTSWSPVKPYPDDAITLTGGPFNTDVAQNSVVSLGDDFDILSVSGTQLVVRAPVGFYPIGGGVAGLFIQSGSAADTINPLYWKRPMNLITFADNLDDGLAAAPARPGDSLVFDGSGFTLSGMSVMINGQGMPAIAVDSSLQCEMSFRVPVSMGVGEDESVITTATIVATNADGRSDTLTFPWGASPDHEVFGIELEGGGVFFDQSDMVNNGQVFNFRVYGRHLFGSTPWTLWGPGVGQVNTAGTLGVGGYPDEAWIVINPAGLALGTYNLQLAGGSIYFTLQ
jgi:hypothetical protein